MEEPSSVFVKCMIDIRSIVTTQASVGVGQQCSLSVAGERDLDGDEGIVAERGHRLQVAGAACIGLAVGLGSKTAQDLDSC